MDECGTQVEFSDERRNSARRNRVDAFTISEKVGLAFAFDNGRSGGLCRPLKGASIISILPTLLGFTR
jgi:hypothetical protein